MALTTTTGLDAGDPDDDPDQRADEVERWKPDDQLLAVVMGSPHSPRKLTEMPDEDRCHLVAGLTDHGWSAKEIKHRCGGSIRLIRFLRAEPLTRVCRWAIEEVEKVAKEARAEKAMRLAAQSELEQSRRREARLQAQMSQILKAHTAGERVAVFSCKHPRVPQNVYRSGGREFCRECGYAANARYRAKKAAAQASSRADIQPV